MMLQRRHAVFATSILKLSHSVSFHCFLVKNADLKIWSFLAKNMDLPLRIKSIFGRNQSILLKLPIESVCPKMSLRHFLGLPRNKGQRNRPEKTKSG